jgi:hypothetical protein
MRTLRRQEACTLDRFFCECKYEQFCSRGLGWLLELFVALATWPSKCRRTYEGQFWLSGSLIFDENILESGNLYTLVIFVNVRCECWFL